MAYGDAKSSQNNDSPNWGFVGFIIVIFVVAVVAVSFLVLKGNGTL